jgi:hypothetical protein
VRGGLSARQRARLADLSLLLDVVLKAGSSALKSEFVACGLLTQLQQSIGRNWSKVRCCRRCSRRSQGCRRRRCCCSWDRCWKCGYTSRAWPVHPLQRWHALNTHLPTHT